MSRRYAIVLTVLLSGAAASLNAQDRCSLFQPDAVCRGAKGGPALQASFGRAELPAIAPVQSLVLHGHRGPETLFRPAQLQAAAPRKTTAPIDCRVLQPTDPLVDPGMVRRTHSGVADTARVVTVVPCVVHRHR